MTTNLVLALAGLNRLVSNALLVTANLVLAGIFIVSSSPVGIILLFHNESLLRRSESLSCFTENLVLGNVSSSQFCIV